MDRADNNYAENEKVNITVHDKDIPLDLFNMITPAPSYRITLAK